SQPVVPSWSWWLRAAPKRSANASAEDRERELTAESTASSSSARSWTTRPAIDPVATTPQCTGRPVAVAGSSPATGAGRAGGGMVAFRGGSGDADDGAGASPGSGREGLDGVPEHERGRHDGHPVRRPALDHVDEGLGHLPA